MLRQIASALLSLAILFLVMPNAPAAASTGTQPLRIAQLVPPPSAATRPAAGPPSAWQRAEIWLRKTQQGFYRELTEALKLLRERWSFAAGWSLAVVSFLYGVFHAAGPGHGKAVISAYLLANERQLKRGIQLAFLSSLFQALSAIILVSGVLLFARTAFGTARAMSYYMELASYLLIAAMGAVMLWRAVKGLLRATVPQQAVFAAGASGGSVKSAGLGHDHNHHHHGPDCGCGHSHMPAPADTEGDWSLRRALAISLAVGIRPCSGALIVLLFASSVGIYVAGIGATFAMALGTAITVSGIAVLAVSSRGLALRLAGGSDRIYRTVASLLAILGGLALLILGLMLFEVTVTTPANPLL